MDMLRLLGMNNNFQTGLGHGAAGHACDHFGFGQQFMAQLQMAVLGQLLQHVGRMLSQLGQGMQGPFGQGAGQLGQGLPQLCGCPPKNHCAPQHSLPQLKGSEKGGWLAPHGGYKKNKDGTIDITKGKYAGHQAKSIGKGKYLLTKNGCPCGIFNAPGGKDKIASPLTFDLNGNGKVDTTNVAGGKQFDIDGDGKVDQTAWAGKGDGVLAFDADNDGKVGEDGTELFGNNTKIDGQGGFNNGFDALKALAEKHLGPEATADGKLDARELKQLEQMAGLKMMVDGQAKSLSELGITEIDLGYTDLGAGGQTADVNGNEHRQQGVGFTMNGQQRQVNDVWFKYQ